MNNSLETLQQIRWKNSFEDFSVEALGFGPPQYNETPEYMYDWYRTLENPSIRRLIRLAPRSHAKSQVHTVNYALWELYRNPNNRIVVASNTGGMATAFAREIRTRVQDNPYLEHLVPLDLRSAKWTDASFEVVRDIQDRNTSVFAVGANSGILSKRADIIICDDIIDEENSATPGQREKVRTWFWKTLYPVLEPAGRMIIVGTRWHYADLYGELLGINDYPYNEYFTRDSWTCIVQQAILNEEHRKVLWPERWSFESLDELRKEDRAIFACQYQNDPSGLVGKKFRWEWFRWFEFDGKTISYKTDENLIELTLDELDIYIGVDPAISQSEEADYFALVVIGIDNNNNVFVLDYVNEHLTFNSQVAAIFEKYSQCKPVRITLETVAYQQALFQEVSRLSESQRLYLPIKEQKTSRDKVTRSNKLSGMFENGKVFLQRGKQGAITDTLLQFPKGEHDDLFDALDFAVEGAAKEEVEPNLVWV